MTKHIYMTRPIHEAGMKLLRDKGYEIATGQVGSSPVREEVMRALAEKPYDAVVTFLTDAVDKELFDACPSAKLFANYSVGFNNVHLDDAKAAGVAITNTPGCAGRAVAEHAIALMLSVTARVTEGDRYMRAGKYAGWDPDLLLGTDLSGKTIGLIGLGDIGARVARMAAKGFDCKVLYTDMKRNDVLEAECGAEMTTKDVLLERSDIISLHVPLMPETVHLINEVALGRMKKTAILINTARGPVIDEAAFVRALQEGRIAGAGLDVYEHEPSVAAELLSMENVVLTPHIASARESVRIQMAETVAKNIISFFETGKALTLVTYPG
jgi:glyoxylate reductase